MTKVNNELIQTKTRSIIRENEKLDLGSSGVFLVTLKQFTYCPTHSLNC